jgi:hypothetical protein
MSKCAKKVTCAHKFVQGTKKGKRCGKPCRTGNRCKDHNEKKLQYTKAYHGNKRKVIIQDETENKIKEITNCDDNEAENLDFNKAALRERILHDELLELKKKIFGVRQFLGEKNDDISINNDIAKLKVAMCAERIVEIKKETDYQPLIDWVTDFWTDNKQWVITFKGTTREAETALKKYSKDFEKVRDKYIRSRKIVISIEQRQAKLEDK